MAKITIKTELETKTLEKQIKETQEKLETLERQFRILNQGGQGTKKWSVFVRLQDDIERTKIKLGQLQDKLNIGQQVQELGNVGADAGEKTGQGFEKGIKSLKRFALGLFGVRSAFMGLRRATNAYLSENEVTANKMNAIWVALGNALGPIIEIIADGVLKLIGYLNVFLNALGFKVDLTKNIGKNTKAIKDQTKAMKELNREVYSFDEMNKSQKETSAGGGGGTSATSDAFKMPELDENIVKFLENTAKFLKENWEWLVAIGIALGGIKLANWLNDLSSASGLLGGIAKTLGWIAGLTILTIEIKIIYDTVKDFIKLVNQNKDVVKFAENINKQTKKQAQEQGKMNIQYEKGSKKIDKYVNYLKDQVGISKDLIEKQKKEAEQGGALDKVLDGLSGKTQKQTQLTKAQIDEIITITKELEKYAEQGKLTDEQMKFYAETVDYLSDYQENLGKQLDVGKTMMGNLGIATENTNTDLYNQIEALKKNKEQYTKTMDSNTTKTNNFVTDVKNKLLGLNSLKATPKVEFKTDTKNLSAIFETLSKTSIVGGLGVEFLKTANKLKTLGLARGGIINLPGKGVSLNVVGGEATNGAEGIIPMNNEESMDLIGQSIAKHMDIHITNVTSLDNRVIAREQKTINNNIDFVTNGRGV